METALAQDLRQKIARERQQQTTHDIVQALAFVPWITMPIEVYIPLDYRGPPNSAKDSKEFKLCSVHIEHIVQPPFTSYTFEILDQRRKLPCLFEAFVSQHDEAPINRAISLEGGGRRPFRGGVVVMQRAGTLKQPGKHIPINRLWESDVLRFLVEGGSLVPPSTAETSKRRVRHPREQVPQPEQSRATPSADEETKPMPVRNEQGSRREKDEEADEE
ncbi:hypothetical protein FRC04_003475 [Tulasnella sp. 424]|nr:hypothetical protein FRC04_003475 [Tulasnella sp. 424]KAG8965738.1 hypothetical protein FRC05_003055 [Tulasnella sp. 425]